MKEKFFVNKNEMIAILFKSVDEKVEMPCLCHISDTFAAIEESLYKEYPEYKINGYILWLKDWSLDKKI